MGVNPADDRWMKLALTLGRRGWGQTWPNPAVGCVIVKDGRLIGRGWTQVGGRPHAETVALAQAGGHAAGATAYVTLEPCAHAGKTPPCAPALVLAKIARVVSAIKDPDSRVAGAGHRILTDGGVAVDVGCQAEQAAQDHQGFLLRTTCVRPMVTLKLAASFDGRIATASGESRWITGPYARRYVHYMRATHDAVMVGAGTMRADDPALTVRDLGTDRQPGRIFFDTSLSVSPHCTLGKTALESPVWVCHGPDAPKSAVLNWQKTGANLIACKLGPQGRIDITDALTRLAGIGLTRIFCEGGGTLAASLLQAQVVDQMVGFTAGLVLGADGHPSIGNLPNMQLSTSPQFWNTETRQIGTDILHVWRPL